MSVAMSKGPVKAVVEYHIRPGSEAEFERWVHRLIEAATLRHGLEGSSVLAGEPGAHFLLLRFESAEHLERWESSKECADLQAEGAQLTTSGAPQVRHGLATWFTLPEHRTAADPPRWKMALVTWCALYPQIVILWLLTRPLALPPQLDQAVTSMLCVASLTWVVMPRATRLLHGWLVAGRDGNARAPGSGGRT